MLVVATFSSAEEQFVGSSTNLRVIASELINSDIGDHSNRFFALATLIEGLLLVVATVTLGVLSVRRAFASWAGAIVSWGRTHATERDYWWLSQVRGYVTRFCRSSFVNAVAKAGFVSAALGLYFVVLAPAAAVIVMSFREQMCPAKGWTVRHYDGVVESRELMHSVGVSIEVALVVAVISSVIASRVATLLWWKRPWRTLLLCVALSGAFVPADAWCLGLLQLVQAAGIVKQGGVILVVVGHIIWAMPFCLGTVMLRYAVIPPSTISAGLELATGWYRTWRRVIAGAAMPSIVSSAMLAFLLSLNESSRSRYLGGAEELLSNRIYSRLNTGLVRGEEAIIACASVVLAGSIIGGFIAISITSARVRSKY